MHDCQRVAAAGVATYVQKMHHMLNLLHVQYIVTHLLVNRHLFSNGRTISIHIAHEIHFGPLLLEAGSGSVCNFSQLSQLGWSLRMPKDMHCRLQQLDALRQKVTPNSFGQVGMIQHSLLW